MLRFVFGILDFFNMRVFVRTSTNIAHLASFQAIGLVEWFILKTLDIFVCQTLSSQNAAFAKIISSPVSTLSARTLSMCFIPSFAFVSGVVYRTWEEMKV